MGVAIVASNVSFAWLRALEELLVRGGQAVNLAVTIERPLEEDAQIRDVLDTFIAERRGQNRKAAVQLISTVANTVFPQALYRRNLGTEARAHLYEMHNLARPMSRRRNRSDTYFDRLVAWPGSDGAVNQLEQAITRLERARARGHRQGNAYELGVAAALDGDSGGDLPGVPIYGPGLDNRVIGFPCLSHISLTLVAGRVHMTALYRNQHFLRRAYGNYSGLGHLLNFIAHESGWEMGELMCVSAHADAEIGHGRGFGKNDIAALISTCRRLADRDHEETSSRGRASTRRGVASV